MWLIDSNAAWFTDLYELTMAQAYFKNGMNGQAHFEVSIRKLPENWGYFVMGGLAELENYLNEFQFTKEGLDYLVSTGIFSDDFLSSLRNLKPQVKIRALAEGTVFFPDEPILEVGGPLITSQLLESYVLNILGFSIIEATLAARTMTAAAGKAVVDFGLRRCQGPVASLRSARGAQMAGYKATSNVQAAKSLGFMPSGTMAHSFVEAHNSEEQAFLHFAKLYKDKSILLVDTYDIKDGIRKAAETAKKIYRDEGVKIKGIRIDSGDLLKLSKFAREYFKKEGVDFLDIFVSGDLDEYKIHDLLAAGAEIDGFGIGTRYSVSKSAPSVQIIYKIVSYQNKELYKRSPDKESKPGRKSILRHGEKSYSKDVVTDLQNSDDDLLKPFEAAEPMELIQERLKVELCKMDDSIKAIREPAVYPVEWQIS